MNLECVAFALPLISFPTVGKLGLGHKKMETLIGVLHFYLQDNDYNF